MKKITLFAALFIAAMSASAQFTLTTLNTDGFETTDGWPTTFTRTNNAAFSGATSPYTGGFWNNVYIAPSASKDGSTSIQTTGQNTGSQCFKLTIGPNEATTATTLRLRTLVDKLVPVGEWEKYVVSFYAKTDVATANIALFKDNTQAVTDTWQKFTYLNSYSTGTTAGTGTTSTTIVINTIMASTPVVAPVGGYNIYFDDFKLEQTPAAPVAAAASDIRGTSFAANWSAVAGASDYKLYVEETPDGGTTWTVVAGYPALQGNVTSATVSGLANNKMYRYYVKAKDINNIFTINSSKISVTTDLTDGVLGANVQADVKVVNGAIVVTTQEGATIEVFNTVGQKLASQVAVAGESTITVAAKGVVIVKVGAKSTKVVL